ncbi:MAG TPA: hypothetical protein VIG47_01965, partial [Gemmatimonadaceae bacterium]
MTISRLTAAIAVSLAGASAAASFASAQGTQNTQTSIVGFTSANAQHQRELEAKAATLASPANADSLSR